ncbi:adenylate kinase family protein [Microbacterium gorillae]|uniref:hypothetical protein n=1 Tax=Microbacterium gorillae TaxID=1231063 RepID=UPI000694EE93|nr:hypothetical protein [Microbacterium gorillae]
MLLSLTGASGAGKSTALDRLTSTAWPVPVSLVEFDSIGVPEGADTAWRHRTIEHWVREAVAEQADGGHLLLCGQVPMGELLAAPSADLLDGISICVLHCSPETRTRRLLHRGEHPDAIVHHNRFGEWFLAHTLDPTHAPEVIRTDGDPTMRWSRWSDWSAGDPRWRATIIDTDTLTPQESASAVEEWARSELAPII